LAKGVVAPLSGQARRSAIGIAGRPSLVMLYAPAETSALCDIFLAERAVSSDEFNHTRADNCVQILQGSSA
jgi:hypothetical protein